MSSDAITDSDVVTVPAAEGRRGRRVRVLEVIDETADARSVVIRPRPEDAAEFDYAPGQFLTVRVPDAGSGSARCYSLASSPHADSDVKFTVKRVRGGHGSNWICDTVGVGDELEVLPPGGTFGPRSLTEPVVLVAGGSGITPVISIAKSLLFGGSGDVFVLYANRDEESVIFAAELRSLTARFATRLTVVHILESVQGYPTREGLSALLRSMTDRMVYVCGPAPLMDLTADVCARVGFPRDHVHTERFRSLHGNPFDAVESPETTGSGAGEVVCTVEVELDGDRRTVGWKAGQKLLDALLAAGLDAPYSCREGACSACVCVLKTGEVTMAHNEILAEDDVAEGYVLACQAEPVSDTIEIEY
ncbi:ferredoxin--NADP reductase [Gordonia lacunae]|uniref:3-ketosteroid-9-alpha-hydroxylase n=1 Tax=Gordonia lacunae TaxID=417102 RepID=A0A243QFJ6_9ACTN|nr:ferredoxin--NADP reductase [Gordonia lacunae]OUC80539.1 3-ketosteroid-9-alpha-hydroxylase [Gordonia lacunae]